MACHRSTARKPNARRALAAALSAILCCTALAADQSLQYPPVQRGSVVDNYHGTAVADPYRWMEDLDSPQTRAWVSAEGKLTDDYLASITAREPLRRRIATLYDYEKFGTPFHEGGRYFYTHNSGSQEQSVLYATQRLGDEATIVLDPNALSPDGKLIVTDYVAARDGQHLAYVCRRLAPTGPNGVYAISRVAMTCPMWRVTRSTTSHSLRTTARGSTTVHSRRRASGRSCQLEIRATPFTTTRSVHPRALTD